MMLPSWMRCIVCGLVYRAVSTRATRNPLPRTKERLRSRWKRVRIQSVLACSDVSRLAVLEKSHDASTCLCRADSPGPFAPVVSFSVGATKSRCEATNVSVPVRSPGTHGGHKRVSREDHVQGCPGSLQQTVRQQATDPCGPRSLCKRPGCRRTRSL